MPSRSWWPWCWWAASLEARARVRTPDALRVILALQPDRARLELQSEEEREQGSVEVELGVELVRAGVLLVVRPGKRLPVDGEVVEGRSAVDERTITGELIPVERTVGDPVRSGTLDGASRLKVRATAPASEHPLVSAIVAWGWTWSSPPATARPRRAPSPRRSASAPCTPARSPSTGRRW